MEFSQDKNYLVIESGDVRYLPLKSLINEGRGPFEAVDYAKTMADDRGKMWEENGTNSGLLQRCEAFAAEIMEDRCQGIGTVKALAEAALEVTRLEADNVNGWYYLAMAYYQLGTVRKGLKAIDRAVRLEPDGDDLLVMERKSSGEQWLS